MFAITFAAVLWGTTGVAVAYLDDLTPLTATTIGFYRLLISAVALLAFTAVRGRTGALIRITREAPGRVILTGVGLGAYQALYFIAVVNAGVGVATVVSLGVAPVVTTAWESVRHRRRPGLRTITTVAAALTGLALITAAAPAQAGPHPLGGLLAAVASGTVYAISTLLSRELSQRADALTLTTTTSVVGALALLPIAYLQGLAFPAGPATVGLLGYTGVVTTALAYAMFYAGLRTVPGSVAAVVTLLEPLTAALLAVAILGEPLAGLTIAGGVLLLAAVAALYVRPRLYRPVSALS